MTRRNPAGDGNTACSWCTRLIGADGQSYGPLGASDRVTNHGICIPCRDLVEAADAAKDEEPGVRPNFLPQGALEAFTDEHKDYIRKFPGGYRGYMRYAADTVARRVGLRRNPVQDSYAGQGSSGEQIAGGQMGAMRSRVVQGDPGVPSAASAPRATDGAEGFPVTNPRPLTRDFPKLEPWEEIEDGVESWDGRYRVNWNARGTVMVRNRRNAIIANFLSSIEEGKRYVKARVKNDAWRQDEPENDRIAVHPRRNDGTSHAGATRSDVRSPTSTRTEVRSPTSTSTEVRSPTSTSTQAHTSGNVTVTGGAGAGANTHVTLVRPNPALILVHGNPRPPAEVERAWCKFHERDSFTGKLRNVGKIPGAPDYTFALGRCVDVNLGRGWQKFEPRPWLVFDPKGEALWIVAEKPMKLGSGVAGMDVHGITYDPQSSSGKDPSKYRHKFESPRPSLSPVGNPNYCRAVMLDGGGYKVDDWIRD